ncbi:MAG TPA: DUF3592 domain-containing protein, partial [Propylenella sp.]|nr:DUF3592 domain-containing protein [Propylenella sp.]
MNFWCERAGARRLPDFLFAVIAALLLTYPAHAQERLDASALAGVRFPENSWAWDDDPEGAKREAVQNAAAVAERSCGATEFHAWQGADPAAGNALRQNTEAAFTAAGWRLQDFSAHLQDQRILHAEKDGAELVLTWISLDSGVALFLCEALPVGAAAQPQSAAEAPQPAVAPSSAKNAPAATNLDDDGLDLSKAPWAFFALFSTIAALVLGVTIRNRRRAAASLAWPTAPAAILQSEVTVGVDRDTDGDRTTYYMPVVRYAYEVGGQCYEGKRIRFGDVKKYSDSAARKLIEPYAVGSTAEVRYDPAKPSEATLETIKPGLGAPIFIGGIFLVFAFLAL